MLTVVAAMTAGCRAVLLAATAFWLAGRRLLKACIYRDGVLVFRQEGTSDRPLPVSISGADRVSVADRDHSCVTEFHPVGCSSQQQKWRLVVQQACCSRLHLARADFMIGQVDLHVEMASSRPFNRCARR